MISDDGNKLILLTQVLQLIHYNLTKTNAFYVVDASYYNHLCCSHHFHQCLLSTLSSSWLSYPVKGKICVKHPVDSSLYFVRGNTITLLISRGVPGFGTGSLCGVWGRGWTTYLLYGGPLSGPRFNIKMSSYQYRKSHCGDKTGRKIVLSSQWDFLYWLDDIFILNQGPGLCFSKKIVAVMQFWHSGEDFVYIYYLFINVFLHSPSFACYFSSTCFLWNDLFLYKVLCTTIFHRRSHDYFLLQFVILAIRVTQHFTKSNICFIVTG